MGPAATELWRAQCNYILTYDSSRHAGDHQLGYLGCGPVRQARYHVLAAAQPETRWMFHRHRAGPFSARTRIDPVTSGRRQPSICPVISRLRQQRCNSRHCRAGAQLSRIVLRFCRARRRHRVSSVGAAAGNTSVTGGDSNYQCRRSGYATRSPAQPLSPSGAVPEVKLGPANRGELRSDRCRCRVRPPSARCERKGGSDGGSVAPDAPCRQEHGPAPQVTFTQVVEGPGDSEGPLRCLSRFKSRAGGLQSQREAVIH